MKQPPVGLVLEAQKSGRYDEVSDGATLQLLMSLSPSVKAGQRPDL